MKRIDFSDEANKALKLYNLTMKVSREKLLKQQLDLMVKDSTLDIQDKLENKLVEAVDREVERHHILGDKKVTVKAVRNSLTGQDYGFSSEVETTTSNVLLRSESIILLM